jgi:hypothetical protein
MNVCSAARTAATMLSNPTQKGGAVAELSAAKTEVPTIVETISDGMPKAYWPIA